MKNPIQIGWGEISGLFNEAVGAFGTGDIDLALASGDTHRLVAPGTFKIPVVPVLQLIQEHQKFAVFLVALVGIPGETAEDRPEHTDIAGQRQHQIQQRCFQKHGYQTEAHTQAQNIHIQLVGAVAAHHKAAQGSGELCTQIFQPVTLHGSITLIFSYESYYIANTGIFNTGYLMFTECFKLAAPIGNLPEEIFPKDIAPGWTMVYNYLVKLWAEAQLNGGDFICFRQ